MLDVMYFFCVYLYVCILLLEVYIQGCVFIYKNAYLKRTYKKKKCIHYVAHFFLPAAAGRVFKMYTHACTFKKVCPSGRPYFKKMYTFAGIFFRWFYAYTCMHSFFFFYHFAGTLSPPGSGHFSTVPLCFSSAFFLLVFLRLFRSHFSSTLPADIYTFFAPFQAFCSPFFALLFLRTLSTENAVHR